jgi:hypothetical protein
MSYGFKIRASLPNHPEPPVDLYIVGHTPTHYKLSPSPSGYRYILLSRKLFNSLWAKGDLKILGPQQCKSFLIL